MARLNPKPQRKAKAADRYQVTDPKVKELMDRWTYFQDRWRDIREEARKDMRYVSGDPWDAAEKRARQAVKRPCMVMDELGQYVNGLINDLRQNKRAVKVNPEGSGANDKTAEMRGDMIRGIEYQSTAQSAYITGAENAFQRSYGFWRIGTEFESDMSFNQRLVINPVPNPDTVFMDPDAKRPDCSDGMDAFVVDLMSKKNFKKKFKGAKVTDFSSDMQEAAPTWIRETDVQVAEYWEVDETDKLLYLMKTPTGAPIPMWADDAKKVPGFKGSMVLKDRMSKVRKVVQNITNGLEVLEENAWAGKWIPIIPVFGKELWVDDGSGSKRVLMSLIRLARDPYMFYCYTRTTQAELIAMTPKAPYMAIEGQLEGHEDEWQNANTVPYSVLQYKAMLDATGQNVLPAPTRSPYVAQIQELEVAAEAARRAIQAAIGINPLPTAAQRQNEKSGVAIERIQSQADQGSYHFIDNFDRALAFNGRQLDDLLGPIYDTSRQVSVRNKKDEHSTIQINDPQAEKPLMTGQGEHGVTISVGPSFQSEREDASEFADTLVQSLGELPIDPVAKSKLLAMAIKLKNVGVLGDEMADIVSPPQTEAQQQQALQQAQSQIAQYQQLIAGLQAENQKLYAEKNGKVVDNAAMLQKAAMDNDVKVLIALISAKNQNAAFEGQMWMEYWKEFHGSAHEAAMQVMQNEHDREVQAQAQQAAQQTAQMQAQQQPGGATATPGQ